jgi:hypothetical protein
VYRFFFLAPARYALTVTKGGFRRESRIVNVTLGPSSTVNITLEIAKASHEITVLGEAPLIQADNGDVSTTMNQKQISEVPNPGNDLSYIVQTAPGVVMNGFELTIPRSDPPPKGTPKLFQWALLVKSLPSDQRA